MLIEFKLRNDGSPKYRRAVYDRSEIVGVTEFAYDNNLAIFADRCYVHLRNGPKRTAYETYEHMLELLKQADEMENVA